MKQLIPFLIVFGFYIQPIQGQNFSLHFDGTDDYVLFPNCEGMTGPAFTIEGWFKCGYSPNPQVILMSFLDIPEKNANVTLEVRENGLLRFNFRSTATVLGGTELYSTSIVNDYGWHHFAAVKGATTPKGGDGRLRLFVDGLLEVEKVGFFDNISPVPLFEMGRNRYEHQANYRLFHGLLDDLKIWQRAKSSSEILMDHKSESTGTEFGIFSNYQFDTNVDLVMDCSAQKKHGIRNGTSGLNNLPQYSTEIPVLIEKICEAPTVDVQDLFPFTENSVLALISPNPVSGSLNITLQVIQPTHGQIFASDGRLLRTFLIFNESNILDVSALSNGLYFLKLWNDTSSETQRFIKI